MLESPAKKTGETGAPGAACLPPRLPSFVVITGLLLFMSSIPLLFYVLVKLARCFMRQVCSKTICQPSLVTKSLAFNTNLGVRFWVSLLEGGAAGSRNSLQMLDERLAKPSGQTLGEVYLPAFFFLRFCFNWAFATLCGDKSGTGRKTLDSDLSHASCVDIRQVF